MRSFLHMGFPDYRSGNFNGTTQYCDAGTPASLDFEWNQPMWLGAWVYLRSTHPTVDHGRIAIIGKSYAINQTPSHIGFHLICMDNNVGDVRKAMLYLITNYPSPAHYMGAQIPAHSIPLNQWFRLDAGSLDGTFAKVKIWLNGVQQTTVLESDNAAESIKGLASHFTVVTHNGFASFLDGYVNDPIIAPFYPTQADIDKVNSKVPFDPSLASFSGSITSTWRMGDGDTGNTILDRKSSNDLTLINGATFANFSPFTPEPVINLSWTPASSDGTVALWIDPTDNSKITLGTGVASYTDKSASAYVYSQATPANQPTLGTWNGLQCFVGNGSQYLTMASPAMILQPTDRYIIGFAVDVTTSGTGFPSLWNDGDGTNDATVLGFTNNSYSPNIFFGKNGGTIVRQNYNFGYTFPRRACAVLQHLNQLGNSTSDFNCEDDSGTLLTPAMPGAFGTNIDPGRIMAALASNALIGNMGDFVIIKDPSASDVLNLRAYLTRRWG